MTKKKQTNQNKMKDTFKEINKLFEEMGAECGAEITKVAKKLHPDALLFLPLYRGCMVVLKQEDWEVKRGSCTIKLYHDPHWMGHEEITEENLPMFSETLQIFGQRSGADLVKDGCNLYTASTFENLKIFNELLNNQKYYRKIREMEHNE